MEDEKRPRRYAAEAIALPVSERTTYVSRQVPAHLRNKVMNYITLHEQSLAFWVEHICNGKDQPERARRLMRTPQAIRDQVEAQVRERFRQRRRA